MMYLENRSAFRVTRIATFLAFVIVMLGTFARLRHTEIWLAPAQRYLIDALGLLIFFITLSTLQKRKLPHQPIVLPFILIALIIFQALPLLINRPIFMHILPLTMMSNLVVGMTAMALFWVLTMRLGGFFTHSGITYTAIRTFRPWVWLGLIIIALQIILGGWSSTHSATVICPSLPFCQGTTLPAINFQHAFHFGILDDTARISIHVAHRFGGLITFFYIGWLATWVLLTGRAAALRNIAVVILLFLAAQVLLGIFSIVWSLPLPIAVAHNGMAALLLLSVVTLLYSLYGAEKRGIF